MPVFKYKDNYGLFTHIPKTGGESIVNYLYQQGCDISFHSNFSWVSEIDEVLLKKNMVFNYEGPVPALQHLIASDFNENLHLDKIKWIFTFIRHPTDRLLSEYYSKELSLPINVWVRLAYDMYKISPSIYDNHIRPQSDFLIKEMEIFKFPDFSNFRKVAQQKMGIPIGDFPLKNQGKKPKKERMQTLNSSSKKLIKQWYKKDYELWGEMK